MWLGECCEIAPPVPQPGLFYPPRNHDLRSGGGLELTEAAEASPGTTERHHAWWELVTGKCCPKSCVSQIKLDGPVMGAHMEAAPLEQILLRPVGGGIKERKGDSVACATAQRAPARRAYVRNARERLCWSYKGSLAHLCTKAVARVLRTNTAYLYGEPEGATQLASIVGRQRQSQTHINTKLDAGFVERWRSKGFFENFSTGDALALARKARGDYQSAKGAAGRAKILLETVRSDRTGAALAVPDEYLTELYGVGKAKIAQVRKSVSSGESYVKLASEVIAEAVGQGPSLLDLDLELGLEDVLAAEAAAVVETGYRSFFHAEVEHESATKIPQAVDDIITQTLNLKVGRNRIQEPWLPDFMRQGGTGSLRARAAARVISGTAVHQLARCVFFFFWGGSLCSRLASSVVGN